jgi:hypothetical protein
MAAAENGAADAHDGRAFQQSPRACRPTCPSTACRRQMPALTHAAAASSRRRANGGALQRRVGPAARESPSARAGAGSAAPTRRAPVQAVRPACTPLLLASPLMFTCRQMFSGTALGRALLRQALGDLQALDRVHPVETGGDRTRLVALDRTDEMPFQRIRWSRFCDGGDLVDAFLQIVFAEGALALRPPPARPPREGLGNGQQLDRRTGPAGASAGGGDCRFDSLQVGGDCGHNGFL